MQVSNQQLSRINPMYQDDVTVDYTGDQMRKYMKHILAPIYTPLQPQHPVEIRDDNNNLLDKNDVIDRLLLCCGTSVNYDAEKFMNELWRQTLASFSKGLSAASVFVAQANAVAKMPNPGPSVIYTPDDIKDACRSYLVNRNADNLIANCAFYITEPVLMFAFVSKFTFDDFKTYVKNNMQLIAGNCTPETVQKFKDFENMTLDIADGLILRVNDNEGLEPYSFARLITKFALMFANQNPDTETIVPYIDELLVPKNLLFLDIDRISKTPSNTLRRALEEIRNALNIKYKPMSLNKISKLTSLAASKHRIAIQLANHNAMLGKQTAKRKIFKFRKTAISKYDLSKKIVKIINKEVNVAASENYSKTIKSSYMRPSRRNPDNFNIPGKSITMQYKPDLHIYLDTSGSISEDNYRNAILTCIRMALKLNVNLYFNSFSDEISVCTKLNVKGKNMKGIYNEFQKVPKVTGGTDFELVWNYITTNKRRMREISIMITDFGYNPPAKRVDQPPKLYYVPIDVSKGSWGNISRLAEHFCKSMYIHDAGIRRKILM